MEEKCFCHFNGFQVKDATARKAIADHAEAENPHKLTSEDVGAAPSGFGLGVSATDAPGVDWNNATKTGWYLAKYNAPVENIWYFGEVIRSGDTCIIQKVCRHFNAVDESSYHINAERRGYSNDGGVTFTFGEWEWITPPMYTGVEYRTVERFNGKPVYAKMITATASASTTTTAILDIPHGITNFGQVVRCTARIGACVLPIIEQTGNISVYWVNPTNVRIKLNNYSHTKTLGIDIRYVKA